MAVAVVLVCLFVNEWWSGQLNHHCSALLAATLASCGIVEVGCQCVGLTWHDIGDTGRIASFLTWVCACH